MASPGNYLRIRARTGTYALDTDPRPAAVYSLRRLLTNYNINKAINLRRSSDNTNQDIGFVGQDFDVATATTFLNGSNGFITTWYDQSGNGYNATQSTAANQPQLIFNVFGSRPGLLFGGSSTKALSTASNLLNLESFFASPTGGTFNSVISVSAYTNSSFLFTKGNVQILTGSGSSFLPGVRVVLTNFTTNTWYINPSQNIKGAHTLDVLYSYASTSNTPTFKVDGVTTGITSATPSLPITPDTGYSLIIGNSAATGGANGWSDYISEMVFWPVTRPAAQYAILHANQSAYWGTP